MNDYSLTDHESFELQVLYREMNEKCQADRIKTIILLRSGRSSSQAAITKTLKKAGALSANQRAIRRG